MTFCCTSPAGIAARASTAAWNGSSCASAVLSAPVVLQRRLHVAAAGARAEPFETERPPLVARGGLGAGHEQVGEVALAEQRDLLFEVVEHLAVGGGGLRREHD